MQRLFVLAALAGLGGLFGCGHAGGPTSSGESAPAAAPATWILWRSELMPGNMIGVVMGAPQPLGNFRARTDCVAAAGGLPRAPANPEVGQHYEYRCLPDGSSPER